MKDIYNKLYLMAHLVTTQDPSHYLPLHSHLRRHRYTVNPKDLKTDQLYSQCCNFVNLPCFSSSFQLVSVAIVPFLNHARKTLKFSESCFLERIHILSVARKQY